MEYGYNPEFVYGKKKKLIGVCMGADAATEHECGWFTIDELRQWARDEGTIIKKTG